MTAPDLATSLRPGLLLDFHATGLLGWGDVHVAQKVAYLYHETDQRAQLWLALAVRALRSGLVCVDLRQITADSFASDEEAVVVPAELWPEPDGWRQALLASPLVTQGAGAPGTRPLRLIGDLLYLERYWQEESEVAAELVARRQAPLAAVPLQALAGARRELFGELVDPDQELAAVVSTLAPVSVIAGGPGTGKTTTLARVLGMVVRSRDELPRIALAAPTGKAAARMEEALAGALRALPDDLAAPLSGLGARTIHRLLGWKPESRGRFVHDRSNPLPFDLVVIDEASMVSVTLMARLLAALRPQAQLVLIGDPDQLAPVDAGAVLRDIVEAPGPTPPELAQTLDALGLPASGTVVRLRRNYRSVPAITALAEAVLAQDVTGALALLTSSAAGVRLASTPAQTGLQETVVAHGRAMIEAARAGHVAQALHQLELHRLLCAHRRGPYGVASWTAQVEQWLQDAVPGFDPGEPWYAGRPLLVTRNAPDLGLYNGDTGVVVAEPGGLRAHFARGDRVHSISPFLLDSVQTVHAMTVHKAQGSQFDRVTLVLPPPESPLLTRELLYTAITRARDEVTLIGSPQALAKAISSPSRPASGLRERL
ncbi:MAG: exodeoxyribonuclease V subunit alpha [Propionicimonas sp.]|uniref:exodeoxyribonuclease V subunit alpha n=1 Tax=Propionicimonas sp. TaxID=1955623 RepID=UPI002B207A2D|nr:exodeoxyribonuclease V subunit alpha [Propionicimonas sp.]MEA4944149.1 exodeoxyribonuclease V subunit alpha [Propionicimonas sp.]